MSFISWSSRSRPAAPLSSHANGCSVNNSVVDVNSTAPVLTAHGGSVRITAAPTTSDRCLAGRGLRVVALCSPSPDFRAQCPREGPPHRTSRGGFPACRGPEGVCGYYCVWPHPTLRKRLAGLGDVSHRAVPGSGAFCQMHLNPSRVLGDDNDNDRLPLGCWYALWRAEKDVSPKSITGGRTGRRQAV